MNDEEYIQMVAECVRGEHGAGVQTVANAVLFGSSLAGLILPAAKHFVDETLEAVEDSEEQRIMDLLTLPLGRQRE